MLKHFLISACETYGSTFGKFENYIIDDLNQKMVHLEITPSAVKLCLELCLAITEFVCRTVEIIPERNSCHLSKETALSQPTEYMYREGVTLFHRNCA